MEGRPSLIGRERAIVDAVGKLLRKESAKRHDYSAWFDTPRGGYFEVSTYVDGKPTGHIVRITVELDRFEPDLAVNPDRH